MLEKVAFKNFLALRDVEVDLEPFTVIVGPNACGKSTLLEGIHRICGLRTGRFTRLIQGGDFVSEFSDSKFTMAQIISFGSKKPISMFIQYTDIGSSSISLESINENMWSIKKVGKLSIPFSEMSAQGNVPESYFLDVPSSVFLKLNSARMARASYSPQKKPYLEPDGAGLATFCENLQEEQPDVFANIQESLKKIIHSIRRFRITRENIDWTGWVNSPEATKPQQPSVIGKKLVFDFENAENVPAEFVSEGTLLALCILAATAGATQNHVLLIDDLERGLHPRAVKDLIAQLRALQKENPGLQIIATTHSPYVLDYLEGHEIRVATHDPERGMLIAPLNKHPDFERWSEAMDPGQFWSHVGESWVAELQEKTAADD